MNRYPPSSHRPAFALVALAMTALTVGLMVVAPADHAPATPMTAGMAQAPTPTEVLISPARLDIVAVRGATVAAEDPRAVPAKRGRSG